MLVLTKTITLILVCGLICSCTFKSDYEKKIDEQLTGKKLYNNLFLGLNFGQTSKEFFTHFAQLNKKGLVYQGAMEGSIAVHYDLNGLPYPATMNFYPLFKHDTIYGLKALINYNAWAPWNKKLYSDKLQKDIARLLKKWYGNNDFIALNNNKNTVLAKIDGNRRILLFKHGDMYLEVLFTNMLAVHENGKIVAE